MIRLLGFLVALFLLPQLSGASQPNVVFILTDNHGAWTLGCYGNQEIQTPHIDRLAAGGVRFDRAFAVNPVCSPNRATLLTGLIPSQHGVHCFLRGGRLQTGPEARNTIGDFPSLPQILKEHGYACGLVGKWHLGGNLSAQSSLDDYWVTKPHGGTGTFYGDQIIEDGKIRIEPTYTTDFWTQHAQTFIRTQAAANKPFFLFLSYNGPYALSNLLLKEGKNRFTEPYRTEPFESFPRGKPHPWQYNNKDFQNNPISIRRVAAEVSAVDDGVGSIVQLLEELGVDENTIVVFTGDQGWAGGHGGLFGMGDHTRPLMVTDPMMRVPLIWHHPARIAGGQVSDRLTCNYDFLPTILGHLGLKNEVPENLPGTDTSDEFSEASARPPSEDEAIFFEFETLRSVRTNRLKLIRRFPNGPDELFDLENDPTEQYNLIDERPEIRDRLSIRINKFFRKHAADEYNIWEGGGAQTVLFDPAEEFVKSPEPAEPPPLPKDFKPIEFDVPDGYTVQLAAGPPLVNHPMMATFDDRGRLFVAESAGQNLRTDELEEALPNSVLMLEDTDHDGRFDRRSVFADKMTLPMGAAWHNGSLYVASPPNIWRLEDTDNDGVADVREILVSKFGYSGNAASVHGCFVSPDGRIYWCDGRHGHEIQDETGKITSKGAGSYIFSCRPDGTDVRAHCCGGMDNPVEVDFTETGDVFGTVNILKRPPREDCLVHWLYGGTYPHSERVLGEFQRTGALLEPVYSFGHVGVSGMTRYRSGVLDRSFRDDIFVTIFNTGEVVRSSWLPEGSTFHSEPTPFLQAKSPDCHPTDILEDADGSLLLVDTGGWFRIGCPTSQIAKPDIAGGIYRIRRKGITNFSDPWGQRLHWSDVAPSVLVKRLQDTRFKVRERAIAACAARGDAIVPLLKATVDRQPYPEGRLGALWALARIDSAQSRPIIRNALSHPFEPLRKAACQILSNRPDPKAVAALHARLSDGSPHLRRVAAKALGRCGHSQSVPKLLDALSSCQDRSEEHAILFALLEIDDPSETRRGLESKDPIVRRGALIALSQMSADALTPELVSSRLDDPDERVRREAFEIFRGHAQWGDQALDRLKKWDRASKPIGELLEVFMDQPAIASWTAKRLESLPIGDARRTEILRAVARCENPHSASLAPTIGKWLEIADDTQRLNVIAAAGSLNDKLIRKRLAAIAADSSAAPAARLASIAGLGTPKLDAASFEFLVQMVSDTSEGQNRSRAIEILSQSQLNSQQLMTFAEQIPAVGPLNLSSMLLPYSRSRVPEVGLTMIKALAKSKHVEAISETSLLSIMGGYPPEVHAAAKGLISRIRSAAEANAAKLAKWSSTLSSGEVTSGREVFFGKKAQCANCHRIGDDGATVGPNLSQIGRIRSRRDLLEAIMFPSASLAREYESYSVLTDSGQMFTGLLMQTGAADRVTLQPATGKPIVIARDVIETMKPSPVSLMPQGLHESLSEQQLADLIAYLKSLR